MKHRIAGLAAKRKEQEIGEITRSSDSVEALLAVRNVGAKIFRRNIAFESTQQ